MNIPSAVRTSGRPHVITTLKSDAPINQESWDEFCASIELHHIKTVGKARLYSFIPYLLIETVVSLTVDTVVICAPSDLPGRRREATLLKAALMARWPFVIVSAVPVESTSTTPPMFPGCGVSLRIPSRLPSHVVHQPPEVHTVKWVAPPQSPDRIIA